MTTVKNIDKLLITPDTVKPAEVITLPASATQPPPVAQRLLGKTMRMSDDGVLTYDEEDDDSLEVEYVNRNSTLPNDTELSEMADDAAFDTQIYFILQGLRMIKNKNKQLRLLKDSTVAQDAAASISAGLFNICNMLENDLKKTNKKDVLDLLDLI